MANAGVVGMSEVIVPNSTTATTGWRGAPVMWSFIWVGVSIFILMFIHLAMAGRAGR